MSSSFAASSGHLVKIPLAQSNGRFAEIASARQNGSSSHLYNLIMKEIDEALGIQADLHVVGDERLSSCFSVTDLATSSIGAVGSAISALVAEIDGSQHRPEVIVDRRLASLWFRRSISPRDWEIPPPWDAVAGDYEGKDGWIKLHTNLDHHRAAALAVLGCEVNKSAVAAAVRHWDVIQLETEIVGNGGVAAAMRSEAEWALHEQGRSVACEPLIHWRNTGTHRAKPWCFTQDRPLNGLKVLDLTRVIAGPVATRTLAGFGATVIRVDPVGWSEPSIVPDVVLGKRCCFLDLKDESDRRRFEDLLVQADVLVHGYRPGALANLGYDEKSRLEISPALIDVSLDAYGWTGPWAQRRGFDSLVQMSCGIAAAGMIWKGSDKPAPLPAQALDHATGYLMAAAVVRAVTSAMNLGIVRGAKLSLARTAELLKGMPRDSNEHQSISPNASDYSERIEQTPWGVAQRLNAPLRVESAPMAWQLPACQLGSDEPIWL